ncbi:MAG: methyltransferase [Jatrophihabitantaceae bacterium]|nr:methyltransferase [Jatrophihabitantaceae bacterium]
MSTRIVGGLARGRRLAVPEAGTRPTSERAREALFSALESRVGLNGAHVLDLYAGSGAVGLEALSRGARGARMVESSAAAITVIRANAAAVGLAGAHIIAAPVARHLAGPAPDEPFDAVIADPPYDMPDSDIDELLRLLSARNWLAPGAVVVIERSARGKSEPSWPDFVTDRVHRRYGEAALWYGRWP